MVTERGAFSAILYLSFLSFNAHANDRGISKKHFCRALRIHSSAKAGIAGKRGTLLFAGTLFGIDTFILKFAGRLLLVFFCGYRWKSHFIDPQECCCFQGEIISDGCEKNLTFQKICP